MPTANPQHLRVFLASPGDVAEERRIALELLYDLVREPLLKNRVTVDVTAWDDPQAPAPMAAGETPQASVTRFKGRPSDCDLTVVILWSRLGTRLPPGMVRADGSRFESGTVWEYEDALTAGKEVWVYHRTEAPRTKLGDPDYADKLEQLEAVQGFLAKFRNEDGSLAHGFNSYGTPKQFGKLLASHFEAFANSRLGAPAATAAQDEPPVLIPSRKRGHPIVGRDKLLAQLRERVLRGEGPGLVFLPGVGKTAVALELLRDRQTLLQHFDGILWADLGRQPEIVAQLRKWAGALGLPDGQKANFASIGDWHEAVRSAIGDRRLLIVLDDVWEAQPAREFLQLGPNCVYLLTTRNKQIAAELVDQELITEVDELDDDDGLRLLGEIAPRAVEFDPQAARELVAAVQGLPLALVLVGKYLKRASTDEDPDRIRAAMEEMAEAGERQRLRTSDGDDTNDARTLGEIIEVSVGALESEEARRALIALSIFRPKPNTVSKNIAREVCGASDKIIYELADFGLVEHHSGGNYTLHRVIAEYARTRLPAQESQRLHRKALDHYARRLSAGIEEDPTAYLSRYRYEKADWQLTKDEWLYHLSHAGDFRLAVLAFLRVWFDAFFWWGYYRRFPFCDRLIREWRQREVGDETRQGLDLLASFQEAYPAGHEKRGRGDWDLVERSLTGLRGLLALEDDGQMAASGDARRIRAFTDLFLAEARGYGNDDRDGALSLYQAAHDRFVADGDDWTAAWILFYVAEYLLEAGDPAAAAEVASRSLEGADEAQPLDERDPELLANIYRLLGDLDLAGGDTAGASIHYRRATLYAFSFQADPEPADAYTMQCYREITTRIAGRLVDLAAAERQPAEELCRNLGSFWAPYRELDPPVAEPVLEATLAGGDAATLSAALFPPDLPDDELKEKAAELRQRVRKVVPVLFRTLDALSA